MGASTAVHALDYGALRDEIAPAFRRLVASTGAIELPPWLREMLDAELAQATRTEERYADHYAVHRRFSDDLRALSAGLGVTMFGDCEELRIDLAVKDELLIGTSPNMDGACLSSACPGRASCPVHPEGQPRVRAEVFMQLFQSAFVTRCCGEPTWLGRHAEWHDFVAWYAMELGKDCFTWEESELFERSQTDPLLGLLLRLAKRGAALGWSDGGFGEGLLGWLDPEETVRLAAELAPYPLAPGEPVPSALDPHDAAQYLPDMREVVSKLRTMAGAAGDRGIALTRR